MTDGEAQPRGNARPLSLAIAGVVVLVAVAVAWSILPLGGWLHALRGWMAALGWRGALAFAAIYVLGAVLLAPEALLTVVAGYVYGFWGLPLVLVAATIGAGLAFLLARYVLREPVRRLLAGRRDLAAIDDAIRRDGWKIVGLLRLSPLIPFNLQNYLFGATGIPFGQFVAATFVGIIPGAALYIAAGALGGASEGSGPIRWLLLAIGLVATATVVVLVARQARAGLARAGVGGERREATTAWSISRSERCG